MLRQSYAPSPCARKLTPSVHAVLCLQGQPQGAVLRLPFSLSVEETTPFEAKLWSFKKRRRVFEKTRLLSTKTPLFLALCSRLSSQSWALLKIGLWRASFHFTRSKPDRTIGISVLCKESLFFLYSVEKATAKNAHFLVCCAKHSAFSRERHKYALTCS